MHNLSGFINLIKGSLNNPGSCTSFRMLNIEGTPMKTVMRLRNMLFITLEKGLGDSIIVMRAPLERGRITHVVQANE